MFLISKSKYPFGLDISDLSLKLVQLNKSGNKIKFQAISSIKLKSGLIEDGEIINEPEIIKAIASLIKNTKYGMVSSNEVVACLPETKTFIKLIRVEKTVNRLEDVIENELEKHIPYAINEIYFDWQQIHDTDEYHEVLIGAAPRQIVDQYTTLMDKSNLSLTALEIEPVSLCRSLLVEESADAASLTQRKNYALIDFGAKRSSMVFYSKNTILFTVSIPVSGESITKQIAQTIKITTEQAEKAKIICGFDDQVAKGIIKNILTDKINELVKKINEAIIFYKNNYPNSGPIDHVILTGGGANIKGFDQIISQATSIETRVGNIFTNLKEDHKISQTFSEKHTLNFVLPKEKRDKNISIIQNTGPSYATAVGLALRGILIGEL